MSHREDVDRHLAGQVTIPVALLDEVLGILGEDGYTTEDENYGSVVEQLLAFSSNPRQLDEGPVDPIDPADVKDYHVSWEIDAVPATSIRSAAEQALEIINDRNSTGHVFRVCLAEHKEMPGIGRNIDLDVPVLDLQKVCDKVVEAGYPAYVEQTGGGCATIYAGERAERQVGTNVDHREEGRYACLAGPGWFEGPLFTEPYASRGEFYIGFDDDGDSDPMFETTEEDTEITVAAKIVQTIERAVDPGRNVLG